MPHGYAAVRTPMKYPSFVKLEFEVTVEDGAPGVDYAPNLSTQRKARPAFVSAGKSLVHILFTFMHSALEHFHWDWVVR